MITKISNRKLKTREVLLTFSPLNSTNHDSSVADIKYTDVHL